MNNTIYDSVYRTILNDCTPLIIPVINEAFGEHFSLNEKIQLHPNENIITSPEGGSYTRITDSNIVIIGKHPQRYHIECESTENDHTMLVRMYEYDTQIGLRDAILIGNTLHVKLPKSAILYLRHNSNTPDELFMSIEADGNVLTCIIPTIKVQLYSIEEIFKKELYYFLPFHIFIHEKDLALYNKDEEKLNILLAEYHDIASRLEHLEKTEKISELTRHCIINGMKNVLYMIAKKYQNVVEKGVKAMGGEILEYPAKTLWREGLAEGIYGFITEKIDDGLSDSMIIEKLKKYYKMDENQAKKYLQKCK